MLLSLNWPARKAGEKSVYGDFFISHLSPRKKHETKRICPINIMICMQGMYDIKLMSKLKRHLIFVEN